MEFVKYLSLFGFLFFISLSINTSTNTYAVGHTKVDLNVGENGEARASIPINIPKGTILQPSLKLTYSSQGSNGLLGLGWSLSGVMQTISRVPATTAQDGFIDGVDFDTSDRFALNGERLVAISGEYGANETVYLTEQSNFSRVISYGNTGYGPQYFKVWTKDGLILEFGTVDTARVGVANEEDKVLTWLLNKISDTNGNYANINYFQGTVNGEFRPTSIEYTGNSDTGLLPYNRVELYYEDRPDIYARYMAGSHSRFTQRLKNIVVYDHDTFFRRYELEYLNGVGISKLHKVTEFGSDNNTSFKPVVVNWITNTNDAYDFSKPGSGFWSGHLGGLENNVLGDFNGDGRTDMAGYAGDGQWHLSLSTGSGFSNVFWGGHWGGNENNVVGDFDGDGLTDMAGYNAELQQWHVSISTGDGFNNYLWTGHLGGVQNNVMGDFNGDGRTDLAGYNAELQQWHVSLSTGDGFQNALWSGHIGGAENNVSGDFNGDGRTDLAGYSGDGLWHVTLSTGDGFLDGGFWEGHSGGSQNNIAGDFNSDGLTDLAGYNAELQKWHVSLSTGTGFQSWLWEGHYGGIENNSIGDFNGDGRTDLAGYNADLQMWHVSLSTGSGFDNSLWQGHAGGTRNNFVGDYNGDGMTDILGHSSGSTWHVALSNGRKELVNNIVHGNDVVSVFEYNPITNTSAYTKGNSAVYPKADLIGAMYVVTAFSTNDGLGGRKRRTYEYFEGKFDHTGRGFRGFEKVSMVDYAANSHVTTIYDRDHRHIGARVKQVIYKTLDGQLVNVVDQVPEAVLLYDRVYFSYYKSKTERFYELHCADPYMIKNTNFFYDNYGNTTRIEEDNNGQYTVVTNNTFINNDAIWHLGRLTEAVVEKAWTGQTPTSKKSTFEYDTNGNLIREILLPDHPTRRLETVYTLDDYGNRVEVTQSGPGIQTRSDYTVYDPDGRNIIEERNALGHAVKHTYALGYLETSEGPNGLVTTFTRDVFGREIRTDYPDGTWETMTYNHCGDCPSGANYFLESKGSGKPLSRTYFDKLDRELKTVAENYDGNLIHQDMLYNPDGTTQASSDPYFPGQSIYWTTYEYDPRKRVTKETRPGNEITTYFYNEFETRVINSENQTSTRIVDALGNVIQSIDHFGSELTFIYDNDLNLITRQNHLGDEINSTYDERGFQVSMSDPNLGSYTYEYNTLGQLIRQHQPNNTTVEFEYDLLNRMVRRIEAEGVTTWAYDPVNSIGSVATIAFDGAVVESFQYDALARLQSETYVRNGEDKTFSYTYDANSFLSTETYPNNYQVRYEYNERGFLGTVIEEGSNNVLWQAGTYDENGRLIQYELGNGLQTQRIYNDETEDLERIMTGTVNAPSSIQDLHYSFSKLGNLKRRSDANLSLTENFTHDQLNRLTRSEVVGQQSLDVAYDILGNIIYKSDVGDYKYERGAQGRNILTSIDHSRVPGCGYNLRHNITYTSYNHTSSIENGSTRVEIDYGPKRDRTQFRKYKDGQLAMTKTFVGSSYEEVEDELGALTTICYLKAGDGVFAFVSQKESEEKKYAYLHTDHLGSVHVMTNEVAVSLEQFSYDAWGKQRDAYTWENLELPPAVPTFAKGFTIHEMLDLDWLVFMNARVYSPVLGRFLSPDPFIQFGENMQSFNRFAYVLNNPLSFTDPSGYFLDDIFDFLKENVGTIVGIAIGIVTAGWGWAAVFSGAAAGFGASFTDALLAGNSFSDAFDMGLDGALWGAVNAGITYGLGSAFQGADFTGKTALKAVVHGVAQGGIAEARGGDFKSGFIGGAIPQLAKGVGLEFSSDSSTNRVIVSAVVGGTVSQLSGGKFANGALSAAFVQLFNDEAHRFSKDELQTLDQYASKGDRAKFYSTLCDMGEKVGCLALDNVLQRGKVGNISVLWTKSISAISSFIGGGSLNLKKYSFQIMERSNMQIQNDGYFSADKFDQIHFDLLKEARVPAIAYGGFGLGSRFYAEVIYFNR